MRHIQSVCELESLKVSGHALSLRQLPREWIPNFSVIAVPYLT